MSEERSITQYQAIDAAMLEKVVVGGNLTDLTPAQRLDYYKNVTGSLGLNPLTKPFQYITLNGKLTLYATRDCTDQLRKLHNVNINIVSRDRIEDVYAVTARATLPNGRVDESIGAVSIANLKGDNLANALMKAETKAKRRVTLSIVGLGMLDESEIETVRSAAPVHVDMETGEIVNGSAQPTNGNGRTARMTAGEFAAAWEEKLATMKADEIPQETFNQQVARLEAKLIGSGLNQKQLATIVKRLTGKASMTVVTYAQLRNFAAFIDGGALGAFRLLIEDGEPAGKGA